MTDCDRQRLEGRPDFAPSSETPGGYVGQAAFDCCQTHRKIARGIFALANVLRKGGSQERLYARIGREVFDQSVKRRRCTWWPHQETIAGAACRQSGSLSKSKLPITRGQLRTVESGSPPGGGRTRPSIWYLASRHPPFRATLTPSTSCRSILRFARRRSALGH